MDDYIRFLRARLDEQEKAAGTALGHNVRCWELEWLWGYERVVEIYEFEDGTQDSDSVAFFGRDGLGEHISFNDPTYTLADIAAKRKILDYEKDGYLNGLGIDAWGVWTDMVKMICEPFASHPEYPGERP